MQTLRDQDIRTDDVVDMHPTWAEGPTQADGCPGPVIGRWVLDMAVKGLTATAAPHCVVWPIGERRKHSR